MNLLEIRYEKIRDEKGRHWVFQISSNQHASPIKSSRSHATTIDIAEVTLTSPKGTKSKTLFFTGKRAQRIYEEIA